MYLYSDIQYPIGGFRRLDGISLRMWNKLASLAGTKILRELWSSK